MDKSKGSRKRTETAYQKLKSAYRELKDSHIEMVFRLALIAEYRDPATGIHLVRIADYSTAIAEALQLPASEVDLLRYSSPMHDIGKIMLPDIILKKKGRLTLKEKELMRKHPEVGARIFEDAKSPMMRACGVIAMSHHERFDGKGYPCGIKGEDIPLYGRIVAVADCFDAYASKRPYKIAYGFEKSFSMIMERAGGHFDPAVVMAFSRDKKKIKRIWDANRNIEAFLAEMGIKFGE